MVSFSTEDDASAPKRSNRELLEIGALDPKCFQTRTIAPNPHLQKRHNITTNPKGNNITTNPKGNINKDDFEVEVALEVQNVEGVDEPAGGHPKIMIK